MVSRRAADLLIEDGKVTVNGKKVYELGVRVNPSKDTILVEGKPLRKPFEKLYIMLHKPRGVLVTLSDPMGRPTIMDYIEKVPARVFPVGRLDWDSEGLLLLTNDGEWAQKISHPKSEVTKTYLVKVEGEPRPDQIQKLRDGVSIIGGKVKADHISRIKRGHGKHTWYKVIISEGKNRQIRQMFFKIGYDVLKLQRVAIGKLRLGRLDRGECVFLNEVAAERVFLKDEPDAF